MMLMAASQRSALIALVSPAGGVIAVSNGTSVACTTVQAIVNGGYAPYTYAWTDNAGGITMNAPTSVSTPLQATGTDAEHNVTVTLEVTDAKGDVAVGAAIFVIFQGTPP
jgi:hypothetical protein